jgi:hypothetical protein
MDEFVGHSSKETFLAQIAILTSLTAFSFASLHDGANIIVAFVCGMMPCLAFLISLNSSGNHEAASRLWIPVSVTFVLSFIRIMLGAAKKGVNMEGFQKLLRDAMAIFLTGAASAHVIFALFGPAKESIVPTIQIGAACSLVFAILVLERVEGRSASLFACVVPCAIAAGVGYSGGKVLLGAAIGFFVASSLECPPRSVLRSDFDLLRVCSHLCENKSTQR